MKRYNPELVHHSMSGHGGDLEMMERENGQWVKFSDLAVPTVMGLTAQEVEALEWAEGDERISAAGRHKEAARILASCVRRLSASTAGGA